MTTLARQTILSDEYVSLNALFGIDVGTAFNIQVQYIYSLRVHFGTAKPPRDTDEFRLVPASLTDIYFIESGSEEVFARADMNSTIVHAEV